MSNTTQASEASKPTELNVGDVIDDRYRIQRLLGRGGMGTVYEAEQVTLKRQIALKVLLPAFAQDETSAKRFEREATAASSIDHRNVVKILDFGHLPTGELYYTMELLQGQDLAQLLRENGALPWSRAGWIILQVVRAFAAIHEQGIVHRDLKPANCFLLAPKAGDEPDFVKVLDFGIANLQDEGSKAALTGAKDILGSLLYMAPEQWDSERVDSRTDIYALGIMMYELLTGDVPFREPNIGKLMLAHQQRAPRPPRELNPDIPPEVADLIMCALSKSPKDRPQAMADIEAALTPLVAIPGTIEGSRTAPRAGSSSMRFRDTYAAKRRQRWLGMVVAAVVMFVVALAVTRWIKKLAEEDREAVAVVDPAQTALADTAVATDPEWLLLLPEKQYNPFADPFGHASLAGLMVPSPDGSGTLVPLETLLPREPWLLEPGRIAGRILNDRKRPIVDANVCVWMIDPTAPAELRRRPVCKQTDRQGRFELEEVRPGYYDVNVFARGFLPQSYFEGSGYPLTVQPEGSIEGIEMTLVPGGVEVRGVVKSKLGDRLEQAKVAVVGPIRTLAVTNEAGEFSLWVAEGELSLVAWAETYADAVESGAPDKKFSFNLSRESVLEGKVLDAKTSEPIQGARVRATSRTKGLDPLVYTNSKGEFRIPGLLAGEYEPSARTDEGYGPTRMTADAFRPAHNVIKVREGAIAEVEIKLLRAKKVAVVEKEDDPPPTSAGRSTGSGANGVSADGVPGASGVPVAGEPGALVAGNSGAPAGEGSEAPVPGEAGSPVVGEPGAPVAAGSGAPVAAGSGAPVVGESGAPVAAGSGAPVAAGAGAPGGSGPLGGSAAPGGSATPGGSAKPGTPGGSGPAVTGEPTTQKQVDTSKPKDTDRARVSKLKKKLELCGKGKAGTITVTAALVRATGHLTKAKVVVDGEAAQDPEVETCAEKHVESFQLLPRDEVSEDFEPIVVNL